MSFKIHYSFFVYILILFFLNLLQYYLLFFISILIHEIFHGLVGKMFGLKIENISISFSGLSLKFNNFNISLIKKIIVLLSGPVINLIIFLVTYYFIGENIIFFALCNIILFLFNILPIYPLDGGKILFEILKERRNINYEKVADIVQKSFCVILVLICIYMYINFQTIQLIFVGIYLLGFTSLTKYNKYLLK